MSRAQLALNVPDIDEAVTFYSKLFATEPPDGSWEIYTVLEDSDAFGVSSTMVFSEPTDDGLCCASMPEAEARRC